MNPRKIKALIFDFDGTICDSLSIKGEAFSSLYKSYGQEIQKRIKDFHDENGGVSRTDKFIFFQKEIVSEDYSKKKINELSEKFSKIVTKKVIEANFIDGALEFLNKHHKNYKLFISSATPTEELKTIIKEKQMAQFFNHVYGSPQSKSDHIRSIMEITNYSQHEIVFVGDAFSDQYAAKNTGVKFIAVGENDSIKSAAKRIPNLFNLEEIILRY